MDSLSTSPISNEIPITDETAITSDTSTLEDIAEKVHVVADKQAKERNLTASVILDRLPPIDICVFGRSGIGKSQLIKAITRIDIPISAQIDHVTQSLTRATTTIGTLQFRFWDTKGFDSWLDIDFVHNLFNEMKEQDINPIFIIYCAAAGGRVDSDIVAGILKNFQEKAIPICYVITNIYGARTEQLQGQIDGGRYIMDAIFGPVSVSTGKLCYHYGQPPDSSDNGSLNKHGILIGVNSLEFSNIMGTMPILNIHE
ncbi:unnamed protein product [Rotaria socialis]|uniref:G domain-containing protein n=4 Tax=Rotaria socialis TaxID=392032 RepID=A0A818HGJ1_9BILA|nr:unnamed protein product [Rotaria socialis]CAF3615612.1 unnamed protein product [Rotaria socialis]CAF4508139.1 unnamed protein product [Rotaria socialis]CAF4793509.1 unnamed protein product [Rotaria socialis]